MFYNGPEMDGGDTACLGPTTMIEVTIPRCQSSSAMTLDDTGGLAGSIKTQDWLYVVVYDIARKSEKQVTHPVSKSSSFSGKALNDSETL